MRCFVESKILLKKSSIPTTSQNEEMFKRSALALEAHLSQHEYLVEDRFSVTDIIVSWCLNWGRRQGHLSECPALLRYLERLLARPLCTLARD